jgi:hypothetical protein
MWKTPRSLAVAGVALAAGLGVGAVALPAFAAQDPVLTEDQQSTLQAQIDAYQSCLESQGVTLPEKPADGTRPEITDEQRDAMRAAREACQDQRPERPQLTDEQRAELQSQREEHRTCMEEQLSAAGITRPEKPAEGSQAPGERPQRPELTDDQKAAVQSARDTCADLEPNLGVEGIGPMGHGGHGGHGGPGGRMGPGGPDGPADQDGPDASQTSAAV